MYDKYLKDIEDFLTEKTVDPKEFPWDKKGGKVPSTFLDKGKKDGKDKDDIVDTKQGFEIPAKQLNPSQSEIFTGKGLSMAIGGVNGGNLNAIISKDKYILDGHHRWLATMLNGGDTDVGGTYVDLPIKDLIPVLRSVGNALNNDQRGNPGGDDKNIFQVNVDELISMATGETMPKSVTSSKFWNEDKAKKWVLAQGNGDAKKAREVLGQRLANIQKLAPPASAPKRIAMPVIDADKGQVAQVADKLKKGEIDVTAPYAPSKEAKIETFVSWLKSGDNTSRYNSYNDALNAFNKALKGKGKEAIASINIDNSSLKDKVNKVLKGK